MLCARPCMASVVRPCRAIDAPRPARATCMRAAYPMKLRPCALPQQACCAPCPSRTGMRLDGLKAVQRSAALPCMHSFMYVYAARRHPAAAERALLRRAACAAVLTPMSTVWLRQRQRSGVAVVLKRERHDSVALSARPVNAARESGPLPSQRRAAAFTASAARKVGWGGAGRRAAAMHACLRCTGMRRWGSTTHAAMVCSSAKPPWTHQHACMLRDAVHVATRHWEPCTAATSAWTGLDWTGLDW